MRTTIRQTCENRTITVDFRDEATYLQLLGEGAALHQCPGHDGPPYIRVVAWLTASAKA